MNKIRMNYLRGFIEEVDFQYFQKELSSAGIEFEGCDYSNEPQALADLVAPIAILLTSDFYVNFTCGVLASLTVEVM